MFLSAWSLNEAPKSELNTEYTGEFNTGNVGI